MAKEPNDIKKKKFKEIIREGLNNGEEKIDIANKLDDRCSYGEAQWNRIYVILAFVFIISNLTYEFLNVYYGGSTDHAIALFVKRLNFISLIANILQAALFFFLPFQKAKKYRDLGNMTVKSIIKYHIGLTKENKHQHEDALLNDLCLIFDYAIQITDQIANQQNDYLVSQSGKKDEKN